MNIFLLLSIPRFDFLWMVQDKSDKSRVCSTYVSKMVLGYEKPKVSRARIQFNDIQISVRYNPSLPIQEPHPDAQSDTESINSSWMDIIGETPNRPKLNIDIHDFKTISLNNPYQNVENDSPHTPMKIFDSSIQLTK